MPDASSIAEVTSIAGPLASTLWHSISDFVIILVIVLFFILFSRYVGRGQFVAVILAIYSAYALYVAFPYESYLPQAPEITAFATHLGLFLALAFMFYIILRRIVVSDFLDIGSLSLIFLSFLIAGILIALGYHVFDITNFYQFTPPIDALFAPKEYFFWWFVAPAIGLFFLAH
ncbi:MAG: hypothetical protein AAB442_01870 [Patescibacteria group bacterium]